MVPREQRNTTKPHRPRACYLTHSAACGFNSLLLVMMNALPDIISRSGIRELVGHLPNGKPREPSRAPRAWIPSLLRERQRGEKRCATFFGRLNLVDSFSVASSPSSCHDFLAF